MMFMIEIIKKIEFRPFESEEFGTCYRRVNSKEASEGCGVFFGGKLEKVYNRYESE